METFLVFSIIFFEEFNAYSNFFCNFETDLVKPSPKMLECDKRCYAFSLIYISEYGNSVLHFYV